MVEFLTQQDSSFLFFQFFPHTGSLDRMWLSHHTQIDSLRLDLGHDRSMSSVQNSTFFGSSRGNMSCSWYHSPKGIIRSKRPVGAISTEMGDLCPFPISSVIGWVYLWPPDEVDSQSKPTILKRFLWTLDGMSSCSTNFSLSRKQQAPESSKTWMRVRLHSTSNWAGPSGQE